MKLVRFGPAGGERPGIWTDSGIVDIRAHAFDIEDFDSHFFGSGGLDRLRGLLAEPGLKKLPGGGVRLGPPIAAPRQVICIGKNYADHAAEFDAQVPSAPLLFMKSVNSLIGPADPICISSPDQEVDAEAELAVVLGASGTIAGYTALNDVTDRRAQREDKQWFRGKSRPTFCPLGPWLVTADEIPNPQALRVQSRINGRGLQDGNTRDMIFPIAELLAYIRRHVGLNPGDIVSTGTPAGVGFARKPPVLLRAGDVIEVEVENVGVLRNPVQG